MRFVSGTTDDDIVLEVVVLLGTVAGDSNGARLLMESGIVDKLINILSAKQEDDEIVLQIVYIFYQMMFHDGLRKKLLTETRKMRDSGNNYLDCNESF